ncbi:MAG TPA: radical SAM protein [Verrucomicrobia bacterium]|nr:radical SAM protein [Verrucomicrobiota bacterium]
METNSKPRCHVFGPVPSRRLGRSLGVDLVPFKTCTYDCIYCQLGHTTNQTVERKEWVPMDAVLDELKRKLACRPDYITLSGSGEPTLHSRLGEIIEHIQAMTKIPVAVLTNGSLLWQKEVREQVALADVVLPSLDAGDSFKFGFINRPHADLAFEQVVEGLIEFRSEFTGQYWLEVFLLGGHTAIEADVRKLAAWVRRIRPDRVQLNTVARPPAEDFAAGVSPEALEKFARHFNPPAEVVAERTSRLSHKPVKLDSDAVLDLLRRRPCTAQQVARGLGLNQLEILKWLEALAARGDIETSRHEGDIYYRASAIPSGHPPETSSRFPNKRTLNARTS